MNRWIDWNLCVDKDGGPRHVSSGFGAPICANEDGTYRKLLTYHYIGHFSRYILPGARRIAFSRCDDRIELTAAKNPDGSLAVVLLNRGQSDASYAIRIEGRIIRILLPAKTISTICIS
jgi:glucosylceramidase